MTSTFEAALERVIIQKSIFESQNERAVEIGVVLPLLRQVGWNTENVSEIYPQHGLSDGSKVDYDLQIDGESRILIEVKRWGHILNDEDEDQLAGYCRLAKPKLAVLTSGRNWRLYLPPNRGKSAPLRWFHEIDITSMQSAEVERAFGQFLARSSMVDFEPTAAVARKLHRESQAYQRFEKALTKKWNELANDKNTLADLVLEFTDSKGIPTSQDNVMRFLDALHGPLVNEVPATVKTHKKPASFVLFSSPAGKRKKTHQVQKKSSWNSFLVEVCKLMQERHPESFRQNMLSMTDWFADIEDSQFYIPVGDSEIYARWGNTAREVRDACQDVVTKFDYPTGSLEIRDSNGATL